MGVKGLLPCLQPITRSVSLEQYRGLTVAVDAMSWLHKGVFACDVRALAKSQRGDQSDKSTSAELKCIDYTTNKAETLKAKFGIEVILVIDGDALPSKNEENMQRREERNKAFGKAMAAEKAHDSRSARRFYAQSCSVTHAMRYELIKKCKEKGLAYLVAPYEADAQMARLAQTGFVDLVITEDSDILVYGCPRALFKVDFATYQGQEIQLMRDLGKNDTPSFRNWTHDMFVFMCIISGCDYCKGVPGIGIKLAHKLVRVHRTPSKIFSALRAAGRMPPDFEKKFFVAFRTFRHQRVFCPSKQQIETLWPIAGSNDGSNEEWPFLGDYIVPQIAIRIADGTLHPSKKIPWDEALKSHHGSESMPTEVEVCQRSFANPNTRHLYADNNQKSNIWYSLVYGSSDDHRQGDSERNEQHHSDQNNTSKGDMFSFFPKHKNQGSKKDAVEAIVGTDTRCAGPDPPASKPKSKYVPPAHHRDLPIHFNEYASRLVGRAFNPLSRKRKMLDNDGTKSAKYVQKIWEKCAEIRVSAAQVDQVLQVSEIEKKADGVSRFAKDERKVMNTSRNSFDYDDEYFTENFRDSNDDAHQVQAAQNCDALASFSMHHQVFDYTRQDCYLPARGDESAHPSHDFYTRQLVGTQNWYPEDLGSANTTCGEGYNYDVSSYAPGFESHTHENPPQSQCRSECVDSMSTFFEDSNIDDRDLFVGLQSLNDRHYDCQISCNRYGINISGLTTEVRRACASFAGIPTAPRTVVKRKRSDSFGHYDHDMDRVNTAGHVVEDYRAKELGSIYPEYEQLRTAMKKRQYVSYEDSVADDAESSFYWSDNMFGGRGSNHDTVPLSMYR
jgi:exonuclease-1